MASDEWFISAWCVIQSTSCDVAREVRQTAPINGRGDMTEIYCVVIRNTDYYGHRILTFIGINAAGIQNNEEIDTIEDKQRVSELE